MTRRRKGTLVAATIVVLAGAGAGIAAATGDDEAGDEPIAGNARDRASAAALEHTGGGRVTDTEVGDEEGYYEVEVTRDGGSQVDVHLDRDFNVLGVEADGEGDEANEEER